MKKAAILISIQCILIACSTNDPKSNSVETSEFYSQFNPTPNDRLLAKSYKMQNDSLDKNGIPKMQISYFNYDDFETWDRVPRIIFDPPYNNETDITKVPKDKIRTYYERFVDSILIDYFSELLYQAKEPILKEIYLNKEIYRFIWTRTFDDKFIIKIWKDSTQCFIETIRIDKMNGINNSKVIKKVSASDFKEFKNLIVKSKFWLLTTYDGYLGIDGSHWIFEAHTDLGYHVMCRFTPQRIFEDDIAIRDLGEWLIRKSELKSERIY